MTQALSTPQRWLLNQVSAGDHLWRLSSPPGDTWILTTIPLITGGRVNNDRIVTTTARALEKRQLIEPTGLLYWRLTDAGRAAIAPPQEPV